MQAYEGIRPADRRAVAGLESYLWFRAGLRGRDDAFSAHMHNEPGEVGTRHGTESDNAFSSLYRTISMVHASRGTSRQLGSPKVPCKLLSILACTVSILSI